MQALQWHAVRCSVCCQSMSRNSRAMHVAACPPCSAALDWLQGKRVVRLKGGCPSTFSRVSSEAAALSAAGCAFELVPGVSTATAAAVLAGKAGLLWQGQMSVST
jgi:siroheme synthase